MKTRKLTMAWMAAALLLPAIAPAQSMEVDIARLLNDPNVFPKSFTDGVITVEPPSARMVIMIPLRLPAKVDAVTKLESPIKLTGGQFVAWYIPVREAEGQQGGNRGFGPGGPIPGGGGPRGDAEGVKINNQQFGVTPPRIVRDAELHPGGNIAWKISKAPIQGTGIRQSSNLYAIVVDPKQMPPAPKQRVVTGTGPQIARQRTEAQQEYRRMQLEYAKLNEAIKKLPTSFAEPAPQMVYAIYYAPASLVNFGLIGESPLPWTAPLVDFEDLRTAAKGGMDMAKLADLLTRVTRGNSGFSLQLAASVLASGGNLSRVEKESPLVPLINKIVADGGSQARFLLVETITKSTTAMPVAGPLLNKVMADEDPAVALMAMRARVVDAGRAKEAELSAADIVAFSDTATRLLADENGPPVEAVIQPAFDLAGQNEKNAEGLLREVKIGELAGARRDGFVKAVVARARQRDAMALRWFDKQLIGSTEPEVVKLTLVQALRTPRPAATGNPASPTPGNFPGPAGFPGPGPGGFPTPGGPPTQPQPQPSRSVIGGVFDRLGALAGKGEPQPAQPLPGPGGFAQGIPQQPAKPDQPFPLDRTDHSLFTVLQSKDEEIRTLAWRVLPKFVIVAPTSSGQPAANVPKPADICLSLASAAAALDPTPTEVVDFFKAHQDKTAAEPAIQRILAAGRGQARIDSMLWLATSNSSSFAKSLEAMTPNGRMELVQLWYSTVSSAEQGAQSGAPLTVGLLRVRGETNNTNSFLSKLLNWFSQEVAKGNRPDAKAWAAAAGGEGVLIPGVVDPDELVGLACATGLWSSVMPPSDALAKDLRSAAMSAAAGSPNMNEASKKVQQTWTEMKAAAIKRTLSSASGKYNLTLRITPSASGASGQFPGGAPSPFGGPVPGPFGGPGSPGKAPVPIGGSDPRLPQKLDLGTVDMLVADSGNVTIKPLGHNGQVVKDTVKINLDDPAKLLEPKAAEPPKAAAPGTPPSVPGAPGAPPGAPGTPPAPGGKPPAPGAPAAPPAPAGKPPAPGTPPGTPAGPPPAAPVSITNPVELTLDARGRWVGTKTLPDQRVLKVVLTPVK